MPVAWTQRPDQQLTRAQYARQQARSSLRGREGKVFWRRGAREGRHPLGATPPRATSSKRDEHPIVGEHRSPLGVGEPGPKRPSSVPGAYLEAFSLCLDPAVVTGCDGSHDSRVPGLHGRRTFVRARVGARPRAGFCDPCSGYYLLELLGAEITGIGRGRRTQQGCAGADQSRGEDVEPAVLVGRDA
eukprot:scaffold1626_cov372-Prasinococcus_capsulatus_cf.AAC.19